MKDPDRFLLAGVMGWPVLHSRSPMIHEYWFRQHGLAGAYLPLAIEPAGLAAALRSLAPLGFAGCNLTIPHKQQAVALVDEVDPAARRIGAISCVVVRRDGSLAGYNNDVHGFLRNLRQEQPGWHADAGPAAVIGAGGGSRAVCHGLAQEGAPEIRVVNRTLAGAEAIADAVGGPIQVVPWQRRNEALEGVAMVVNTTSQGMRGQPALDIELDALPASALAVDIVYVPLETPFLAAARSRGNRTVGGLGMLLHQGPLAWKAWFGIEPAVTSELRAIVEKSL